MPDGPHPHPPAGPPDDSGQDWLADPDDPGIGWDDYPPPDDLIEEYFPPADPGGRCSGAGPGSGLPPTVTDRTGRPIAHGCARAGPPAGPGPPDHRAWARRVRIAPLETGTCTHRRESRGYQPGPTLRHLIKIRNPSCTAPGCRRPAQRCDLDHTTPYQAGGRTCECNGPMCKR